MLSEPDYDFTMAVALFAGKNGWTMYFRSGPPRQLDESGVTYRVSRMTVSGYGVEVDPTAQAAIAAHVPFIDARELSWDDAITVAFRGPMLAQDEEEEAERKPGTGLDGCGYGPMEYAPLSVFSELYAARGATLLNMPE